MFRYDDGKLNIAKITTLLIGVLVLSIIASEIIPVRGESGWRLCRSQTWYPPNDCPIEIAAKSCPNGTEDEGPTTVWWNLYGQFIGSFDITECA